MNPILTKTFTADATVKAYRILMVGSDEGSCKHATSANVAFLGGSNQVDKKTEGDAIDVIRIGLAEIEYGAAVSAGDPLTSDSVGRAVPAVFDVNDSVYVIGYAEVDGVAGDIREVLIDKGIVPDSAIADDSDLLTANVTITSAQLLALNATPKSLIAAPGANKAIIVERVIATKAAGTAYAGIAAGEDVALRYTDGSGTVQATIEATGFLDQATAQVRTAVPTTTANLTPTANAALVAHMTSGEIITGDSDLKLRILYRIIDTVL